MRPSLISLTDPSSACRILKISGGQVAIVVAHQDLNSALGLGDAFTACAGEADTFFKELKAFLKRKIA